MTNETFNKVADFLASFDIDPYLVKSFYLDGGGEYLVVTGWIDSSRRDQVIYKFNYKAGR